MPRDIKDLLKSFVMHMCKLVLEKKELMKFQRDLKKSNFSIKWEWQNEVKSVQEGFRNFKWMFLFTFETQLTLPYSEPLLKSSFANLIVSYEIKIFYKLWKLGSEIRYFDFFSMVYYNFGSSSPTASGETRSLFSNSLFNSYRGCYSE